MAEFSYRFCAAAVLCALAVSAWEPPKLPAGRRVQYYVLHPDGNFAYGYDTGEGITHAARSSSLSGFAQTGTFTQQNIASSIKSSLEASSNRDNAGIGNIGSQLQSLSTTVSRGSETQGAIADSNVDKSYSFSYEAADHSRSETADKDGSVKGKFAFVAKDGQQRIVDYEAGSATGFLARGSHLPTFNAAQVATAASFKLPAAPISPIVDNNQDGSYSFSYTADDHSREEASDAAGNVRGYYAFVAKDGVSRKVEYEAGAEKGFVAKGDHIPVPNPEAINPTSYYTREEVSQVQPESYVQSAPVDRSYSFKYNAGDHSREESADAAGNVKGRFSFQANDGVNREVSYEAGAEKGFIAKVVPENVPATVPSASVPSAPVLQKVVPAFSGSKYYHTPLPVAQTQSSSNIDSQINDASYSFSYDAGDHSRQESSDNVGNVRGHYSFVSKDGVNRKIEYEAGADTGFIAKGAHIPQPVPLPQSLLSASAITSSNTKKISDNFHTNSKLDGAADNLYSFSYDAGDHSRQESADSFGNVRGQFSFVAKDGLNRNIHYKAGASTGFLATGDHIPSFPVIASNDNYNAGAELPIKAEYHPVPSSQSDTRDLSYDYSYETDSSKKSEKSDSVGNVVGSFSYVGPDGLTRKVDYHAGGKDGFVPILSQEKGSAAVVSKHVSYTPALLTVSPHVSSSATPLVAQNHAQTKTKSIDTASFRVHTFLPHTSPQKFGYIYDTLP